jgi:hypothetical protein
MESGIANTNLQTALGLTGQLSHIHSHPILLGSNPGK